MGPHAPHRNRLAAFTAALLLGGGLLAQHVPPPAAPPSHAEPQAPQKRGSSEAPTHAPQPDLPPALAFAHVRAGHDAWLAARTRKEPAPPPADRPAGAGRYVCAVLVCADCDFDVPAALGLRRRDVLLLSVPGPFVTPEVAAMLERQVLQERLSLVVLLAHPRCATVPPTAAATPPDALSTRADLVRRDAARLRLPLAKALVLGQRELLLASSDELRQRAAEDHLRLVAAEVDPSTASITWHLKATDSMPMPPVK